MKPDNHAPEPGRLSSRPAASAVNSDPGMHTLPADRGRPALLYVPQTEKPGPMPLVISLHGAGGNAGDGLGLLRSQGDEHRFAILAPASRAQSWDVITGGYGPDVKELDRLLQASFKMCHTAQNGVAIGGFSDGASYALCIGAANGDLFPHILAFSPGFFAPPTFTGMPKVFISHGTADRVLPIDHCSRRIVQRLRRGGYDVQYREFEGGHTIPSDIKADATTWWLQDRSSR